MDSKIRYYFNEEKDEILDRIQFDTLSLYSITRQDLANKMAQNLLHLKKINPARRFVVDATACIGGNTYAFARIFHRVLAIEIDAGREAMLTSNLDLFGVRDKVQIEHNDCMAYFAAHPDERYDVIFFDPPWGGVDYRNKSKTGLLLNDRCLFEQLRGLEQMTTYVAIKIPLNFDSRILQELHKEYQILDGFYRMRLLIITM